MKSLSFLCYLLILGLLVSGAAALDETLTVHLDDTNSYSYEPISKYVVYEIIVDSLPMGTNQSHTLSYGSNEWILTVETWNDPTFGLYRNVLITVIDPLGNVTSKTTSTTSILGNYKTIIQPVSTKLESGRIIFLGVTVNVGLDPVTVQFNAQPAGWSPEDTIAFDQVSGSFTNGETSTVYVYACTKEYFKMNISNYNALAWFLDFIGDVFEWSWDMVVAFINAIPIIGPILITIFEIMGIVLLGGLDWILFIKDNFWSILLTVESLICMFVVINSKSRKSRGSFGDLWGKWFEYNLRFVMGIFWLILFVFTGAARATDIVTKVVEALKPI